MQIGKAAFSGVEVMARLAASDPDHPCTADKLAQVLERSPTYVEQLLCPLRRAGLVGTKRGRGGGHFLNRSPQSITVAEIFIALNQPLEVTGRWPERRTHSPEEDETALLWEALCDRVMHFLARVSLADLAAADGQTGPGWRPGAVRPPWTAPAVRH